MTDVLPVDASCEDIEVRFNILNSHEPENLTICMLHMSYFKVDENLPFLDRFVQNALDNGAVPYSPPSYLVSSTMRTHQFVTTHH